MELGRLASEKSKDPSSLCAELFHDYQFGLKLVRDNTGESEFELPMTAVTQPERWLSDLVVASYRSRPDNGNSPAESDQAGPSADPQAS